MFEVRTKINMSALWVPITVLGTGDTPVNKTVSALIEPDREIDSKQKNIQFQAMKCYKRKMDILST
jgi:hypothetical protein